MIKEAVNEKVLLDTQVSVEVQMLGHEPELLFRFPWIGENVYAVQLRRPLIMPTA